MSDFNEITRRYTCGSCGLNHATKDHNMAMKIYVDRGETPPKPRPPSTSEGAAVTDAREDGRRPMSDQLRKGLEGRLALWRDAIKKLEKGVADSPSHDLRRMIKERAEAFTICADELEAELARTGPPPVVCESCKGTNTERYEIAGGLKTYVCRDCGWHYELRGATPEPPAPDALRRLTGFELAGCADRAKVVVSQYDYRDRQPVFMVAADWDRFAAEVRAALAERETKALAASPSSDLRTWITGAQFMVTPKEAPDGDAPLHVVTVEGLLKWLDERERA